MTTGVGVGPAQSLVMQIVVPLERSCLVEVLTAAPVREVAAAVRSNFYPASTVTVTITGGGIRHAQGLLILTGRLRSID